MQDLEQVVGTFPMLTRDEVRGALDWYILHPERVDEDIRRNNQVIQELSSRR